ncbi:DUF421 domain-containing protein [Aquibacillus kalidii]|uniref:DUF421 domain-containing protein n=1 Tax=Aquibacillus kalidii TaxID=2762597 RepID=UPI0016468CE0|nr:DUF421 domain-containing protein [Aquibacillus kalidii]
MLLFIGKVITLFFIYVGAIRLLGKTALAQLTPHDFGAIFFLAYLLYGSIEVDGMLQGLVGVITVITLYFFVAKLSLWNRFSRFITGEPVFLIRNGKIIIDNLKRTSFSLVELMSAIRVAGYREINDVGYALLEPNGDISVLPKKEHIEQERLHSHSEGIGLPIAVIIDGAIQPKYLKSIHKDEEWLKGQLEEEGYQDLSKIFLATVSDYDFVLKVYLDE